MPHTVLLTTYVAWPAAVVLSAVTVASLVVCLLWTRTSPPWAYFSLPSRAWELGVGGLLAVSAPQWRRPGRVNDHD